MANSAPGVPGSAVCAKEEMGVKLGKTTKFLNNSDNFHKIDRGSMGKIALALSLQIGYNMVTKVTKRSFCMSFADKF